MINLHEITIRLENLADELEYKDDTAHLSIEAASYYKLSLLNLRQAVTFADMANNTQTRAIAERGKGR